MALYLLDTDILSHYMNGHLEVVARIESNISELAVSIIALNEIIQGWQAAIQRARTLTAQAERYERYCASIRAIRRLEIVSFDVDCAKRFDGLKRMKLNVPGNDLRIAATGLQLGRTVVTRNVQDYQRVPGLVIENWIDQP